jgi:hypothetical protein
MFAGEVGGNTGKSVGGTAGQAGLDRALR